MRCEIYLRADKQPRARCDLPGDIHTPERENSKSIKQKAALIHFRHSCVTPDANSSEDFAWEEPCDGKEGRNRILQEMWLFVESWDFTQDFPSSQGGHSIHRFPGNPKLYKMKVQPKNLE